MKHPPLAATPWPTDASETSRDRAGDDLGVRLVRRIQRHWLAVVSLASAAILFGAVWVAYLRSVGASNLAEALSTAYLFLCPQRPSHSYFPFGAQMALEEREVAMFATLALGGVLYGRLRGRLQPTSLVWVAVLSAPMAWDVFFQMIGLWDSNWFWRTVTAVLSTWAVMWYVYPRWDIMLARRWRARPRPT